MPVDDDLELDTEKAQPPKKRSLTKIILWSVVILLLVGGATAGGLYFTGMLPGFSAHGEDGADGIDPKKKGSKIKNGKSQNEPKEPPKPVVYQALEPPFVVNFQDQAQVRFLQVSMEVSTRDPLVIEAVKTHMPVIRNNLVLLLASQTYGSMSTREGKEKLRADALAEVQKILTEQTGKSGVEAVYFTSFVMQ